jgi:hypothetical protein
MRFCSMSSCVILVCALSTHALGGTKSSAAAKSACEIVAATYANASVTTVDIWLDRYHSTFARCFASNVATSQAPMPDSKAIKNRKPIKKLPKVVVKPGIKRTVVIPAKIAIEEKGKNGFRLPKRVLKAGTSANASWIENCSPMLGTEQTSFYLSNTGKRISCMTLRPK